MWASQYECDERFVAMTCPRKPADPGDTRFEHGVCGYGYEDDGSRYMGNEEAPYWLESIDDTGRVYRLDFFSSQSEVFDMIEGFRDSQSRREEADRLGVHPLEIEFAPFGPAWQREQERSGF